MIAALSLVVAVLTSAGRAGLWITATLKAPSIARGLKRCLPLMTGSKRKQKPMQAAKFFFLAAAILVAPSLLGSLIVQWLGLAS